MGAIAAAGYNAGAGLAAYNGSNALASAALATPIPTVNPAQASINAQQAAAQEQQKLYQQQADIALQEGALNESQKALSINQVMSAQAQAYNSSGILLEGSPLIVMEQTRQQGQLELDAMTRRTQAIADLQRQQAFVLGQNSQASLLGDETQFLTQQAQAKTQAQQNAGMAKQAGYRALNTAAGAGLNLLGEIGASAATGLGI